MTPPPPQPAINRAPLPRPARLALAAAFICASAIALLTPPVLAQPTPPGADPAAVPVPNPELILAQIVQRYRSEPFAELVRVTIADPVPGGDTPPSRPGERPHAATYTDRAVVRIDPGRALNHADSRVQLELGDLLVHVADARMTAVSTRNAACYVTREFPPPLDPAAWRQLLPPLPLPQLDLVFANSPDAADGLTPYSGRITWQSAAVTRVGRTERVTITGRGRWGAVELSADEATARLITFRAVIDAHGRELRLQISPLDPGDPASWAIDTAGRAEVASLTDLRPRLKPLSTGDVLADMPLLDANDMSVPVGRLLDADPDMTGHDDEPTRGVLLLHRPGVVPEANTLAAFDIIAGLRERARRQQMLSEASRRGIERIEVFNDRVVLCASPSTPALTESIAAMRARLDPVPPVPPAPRTPAAPEDAPQDPLSHADAPAPLPTRLLVCLFPESSIERFAAGDAAVVIFDRELRIRAIIPADASATAPDDFRAALEAALRAP